MNWLDMAIVLIVLWFAVNAYRAGIVREVVTVLALVGGVVVAGLYYDDLARDVLAFVGDERTAKAVSFLLLFGSVILLGQVVAFLLRGLVSLLLLGWADHLLGAALGLFKGFLLVDVLLVLFVTYPQLGLDDAVRHSLLGPRFLDAAHLAVRLLPAEFDRAVQAFPAH